MTRIPRIGVLAGLTLALVAAGTSTGYARPPAPADPPGPSRFAPPIDVAELETPTAKARLAELADPDQAARATAIVELDAPAALGRLRTERSLTRKAARSLTRTSQDEVVRRIARLGVKATARTGTVVNAVQVRATASQLDRIARLPGVRRVERSQLVRRADTASNLYTGATTAWQRGPFTGRGQTIAIIDSGVDYTHADFGGPGTPAAYASNDGSTVEPGTFPTAKVVGGHDFVGDDYDPGTFDYWIPDGDPLDCSFHGTHVAGTAAGQGVTSDGEPYAGPYDQTTAGRSFSVEPGIAPEATIRAYKIFGCSETSLTETAVIVAAIDRAVSDGVDVINLSLGEVFGTADGVIARAVEAATQAGVLVVAAAGNEGSGAYLSGNTGAPDEALSVAAVDAQYATFTGVAVTGAVTASGVELTRTPLGTPTSGEIVNVGAGCASESFAATRDKIAVATRGSCPLLTHLRLGKAAGSKAVILADTAATYPPSAAFGSNLGVPFVGVTAATGAALRAAAGQVVTLAAGPDVVNDDYGTVARFSSSGPRRGDHAPKPDLAAPGVSIPSALMGSGRAPGVASGTSSAAPQVAGAAALVRQAHPDWTASQAKAALMSTAAAVTGAEQGRAGAGLVRADLASATGAFAWTSTGLHSLTFGLAELDDAYLESRAFKITNTSSRRIVYDLSAAPASDGSQVSFSPRATGVDPGATVSVQVTLRFSRAAIAELPGAEANDQGRLAVSRGTVTATPRTARPEALPLHITYLLVPVPLSSVQAQSSVRLFGNRSENLKVRNTGVRRGTADLFTWLADDPVGDVELVDTPDVTDFGYQVLAGSVVGGGTDDRLMVFSYSMAQPSDTYSLSVFGFTINQSRRDVPDYVVRVVDRGAITVGIPDGRQLAVVYYLDRGVISVVSATPTVAPANSSTVLVPVLASRVAVTAAVPGVELTSVYGARLTGDGVGEQDTVGRTIFPTYRFDAFRPALSQGDLLVLEPGESSSFRTTVDRTRLARENPAGWLVLSPDDAAGRAEADRVALVDTAAQTVRTSR